MSQHQPSNQVLLELAMASSIISTDSHIRAFPPAVMIDGKFMNPVPTIVSPPGNTLRLIRRMVTEKHLGDPQEKLGPFHTDPAAYRQRPASGLRVTWMGHSSVLIEIDGCRILTDPVWSRRASFVSFAGPKRFYDPTIPLTSLPALDAVLLSHDHYDHLDRDTIQHLATIQPNLRFLCSLGIGAELESWGVAHARITEMNWGETTSLRVLRDSGPETGCDITATPARHFSGRGLWSRNETLWSSFVIRGWQHNLFFGGDSGAFPGFRKIGEVYGPFDLTMLEIGAYDDQWPDIHMGPEKAAEAHLALGGRLMLPIHWGLFNLAFHPWREPIERLTTLAERKDISLVLPKPGCPVEINDASVNTFWWEIEPGARANRVALKTHPAHHCSA